MSDSGVQPLRLVVKVERWHRPWFGKPEWRTELEEVREKGFTMQVGERRIHVLALARPLTPEETAP